MNHRKVMHKQITIASILITFQMDLKVSKYFHHKIIIINKNKIYKTIINKY